MITEKILAFGGIPFYSVSLTEKEALLALRFIDAIRSDDRHWLNYEKDLDLEEVNKLHQNLQNFKQEVGDGY